MKKVIVKRALNTRNLQNLTNNKTRSVVTEEIVTDYTPVAMGMRDTFGIEIDNTAVGSTAVRVALLKGYYDTLAVELDGEGPACKISYSSPLPLTKAGFAVDCCADDDSYTPEEGTAIVMSPIDPASRIRDFMQYMRTNPRYLKGLRVISNNQNAFDGKIVVSNASPFNKGAEKSIQLTDFFSSFQQQNDRIAVDFTANELGIDDITVLIAVIPAGAKMKFLMSF